MANTKYTGSGVVQAADYKAVKWVGKTKGGKAVTITMAEAFCKSNIEWTFAEKDDVVPELVFEGVYSDTNLASGDRTEPWTIEIADGVTAGSDEILLGVGRFYVGDTAIGLTRGGGSFKVEREYREINADGDPGMVKDRVEQTTGRPTLTMKALQWLTRVADIYPGLKTAT